MSMNGNSPSVSRTATRLRTRLLLGAVSAIAAVGLVAAVTGGVKDSAAAPRLTGTGDSTSTVSPLHEGAQPYTITTATVGECKAGAECTATITIEATGDYHVNESYPFKFTAAAPGVEFHGASGNVYVGGDFARVSKTKGVMTLKFKPAAAGDVAISGVYKICICTDKICQPTTTNVTVNVKVK
jgi:hypothetical protein